MRRSTASLRDLPGTVPRKMCTVCESISWTTIVAIGSYPWQRLGHTSPRLRYCLYPAGILLPVHHHLHQTGSWMRSDGIGPVNARLCIFVQLQGASQWDSLVVKTILKLNVQFHQILQVSVQWESIIYLCYLLYKYKTFCFTNVLLNACRLAYHYQVVMQPFIILLRLGYRH